MFGDLVELNFLSETRLRCSMSPLWPARRLVGEHTAAAETVPRDVVGNGLQRASVEGARDAVGPVGTAVEQRLQIHPRDGAVVVHTRAEPHQHGMAAAMA